MRAEIQNLTAMLSTYEKKWSKIAKNIIQENADLKSENNKLKKKITSIKTLSSTRVVLGDLDLNANT